MQATMKAAEAAYAALLAARATGLAGDSRVNLAAEKKAQKLKKKRQKEADLAAVAAAKAGGKIPLTIAQRLLQAQQQRQELEDDELGDGLEQECFTAVETGELQKLGLKPHPDKIAEPSSLSSVQSPSPVYNVSLPEHVLTNGISALQFQTVQMAGAKHLQFLPDGSRAGFFLGDGPGVGKGRQIAAAVLDNFGKGRTKAVWFSVSADLAVDATRDLNDMGALRYSAVQLHDLVRMKLKLGTKLSSVPELKCGVLFATYSTLIGGASTKKEIDAMLNVHNKPEPRENEGPTAARSALDPLSAAKEAALAAAEAKAARLGGIAEQYLDAEQEAAEADDRETSAEAKQEKRAEEEAAKLGLAEFGPKSRLAQMVEWFGVDYDGLIVFDECHRAKNCVVQQNGGALSSTKTSRAVVELQRRLKNARVLYVSATGATEVYNLLYMSRLGLWAAGGQQGFLRLIGQEVGAMELVAMELKMNGSYMARSLSYEGVKFETHPVEVEESFKKLYDAAVHVWNDTMAALGRGGTDNGKPHQAIMREAYGTQLRFFRQLCTASKVKEVVSLAQKAVNEGHCVVIGLQQTGEARTEAFVEQQGTGGEDQVFDACVEPAALMLVNLIEKHLEPHTTDFKDLMKRAKLLSLPQNPLDELVKSLGGPDAVAELTGRKRRMIWVDGGYRYLHRATDDIRLDQVNIREKEMFQDDQKRVAIISDAASTGISLQADRSKRNQRLRVHITLELAWSADKTVQQLGRTHRSNQRQPPHYLLVSSSICGEHRFASAVARRLEQLGALTQGDRYAASASDALAASNLHTKFGKEALKMMFKTLAGQEPVGELMPAWVAETISDSLPELEAGTDQWLAKCNHLMQAYMREANDCLREVDVLATDKKGPASLATFLNRLLCIPVDLQGKVFGHFSRLLEFQVAEAKKSGNFQEGSIVSPKCTSLTLAKQVVVHQNRETGVQTLHCEYTTDRGINWEAAKAKLEQERIDDPNTQAGFVYSLNVSNGVTRYYLAIERNDKGRRVAKNGRRKQVAYWRLISPVTGFAASDIGAEHYRKTYTRVVVAKEKTVEKHWVREYKDGEFKRQKIVHLLVGSLLPHLPMIKDRLPKSRSGKDNLTVMRVVTTDTKKQAIGVNCPAEVIASLLRDISQLQPDKPWENSAGTEASTAPAVIAAAAAKAAIAAAAAAREAVLAAKMAANMEALKAEGAIDLDGANLSDMEAEEVVCDVKAAGGKAAGFKRASTGGGGGGKKRRSRVLGSRQSMPGTTAGVVDFGAEQEGLDADVKQALMGAGLWSAPTNLETRPQAHTPATARAAPSAPASRRKSCATPCAIDDLIDDEDMDQDAADSGTEEEELDDVDLAHPGSSSEDEVADSETSVEEGPANNSAGMSSVPRSRKTPAARKGTRTRDAAAAGAASEEASEQEAAALGHTRQMPKSRGMRALDTSDEEEDVQTHTKAGPASKLAKDGRQGAVAEAGTLLPQIKPEPMQSASASKAIYANLLSDSEDEQMVEATKAAIGNRPSTCSKKATAGGGKAKVNSSDDSATAHGRRKSAPATASSVDAGAPDELLEAAELDEAPPLLKRRQLAAEAVRAQHKCAEAEKSQRKAATAAAQQQRRADKEARRKSRQLGQQSELVAKAVVAEAAIAEAAVAEAAAVTLNAAGRPRRAAAANRSPAVTAVFAAFAAKAGRDDDRYDIGYTEAVNVIAYRRPAGKRAAAATPAAADVTAHVDTGVHASATATDKAASHAMAHMEAVGDVEVDTFHNLEDQEADVVHVHRSRKKKSVAHVEDNSEVELEVHTAAAAAFSTSDARSEDEAEVQTAGNAANSTSPTAAAASLTGAAIAASSSEAGGCAPSCEAAAAKPLEVEPKSGSSGSGTGVGAAVEAPLTSPARRAKALAYVAKVARAKREAAAARLATAAAAVAALMPAVDVAAGAAATTATVESSTTSEALMHTDALLSEMVDEQQADMDESERLRRDKRRRSAKQRMEVKKHCVEVSDETAGEVELAVMTGRGSSSPLPQQAQNGSGQGCTAQQVALGGLADVADNAPASPASAAVQFDAVGLDNNGVTTPGSMAARRREKEERRARKQQRRVERHAKRLQLEEAASAQQEPEEAEASGDEAAPEPQHERLEQVVGDMQQEVSAPEVDHTMPPSASGAFGACSLNVAAQSSQQLPAGMDLGLAPAECTLHANTTPGPEKLAASSAPLSTDPAIQAPLARGSSPITQILASGGSTAGARRRSRRVVLSDSDDDGAPVANPTRQSPAVAQRMTPATQPPVELQASAAQIGTSKPPVVLAPVMQASLPAAVAGVATAQNRVEDAAMQEVAATHVAVITADAVQLYAASRAPTVATDASATPPLQSSECSKQKSPDDAFTTTQEATWELQVCEDAALLLQDLQLSAPTGSGLADATTAKAVGAAALGSKIMLQPPSALAMCTEANSLQAGHVKRSRRSLVLMRDLAAAARQQGIDEARAQAASDASGMGKIGAALSIEAPPAEPSTTALTSAALLALQAELADVRAQLLAAQQQLQQSNANAAAPAGAVAVLPATSVLLQQASVPANTTNAQTQADAARCVTQGVEADAAVQTPATARRCHGTLEFVSDVATAPAVVAMAITGSQKQAAACGVLGTGTPLVATTASIFVRSPAPSPPSMPHFSTSVDVRTTSPPAPSSPAGITHTRDQAAVVAAAVAEVDAELSGVASPARPSPVPLAAAAWFDVSVSNKNSMPVHDSSKTSHASLAPVERDESSPTACLASSPVTGLVTSQGLGSRCMQRDVTFGRGGGAAVSSPIRVIQGFDVAQELVFSPSSPAAVPRSTAHASRVATVTGAVTASSTLQSRLAAGSCASTPVGMQPPSVAFRASPASAFAAGSRTAAALSAAAVAALPTSPTRASMPSAASAPAQRSPTKHSSENNMTAVRPTSGGSAVSGSAPAAGPLSPRTGDPSSNSHNAFQAAAPKAAATGKPVQLCAPGIAALGTVPASTSTSQKLAVTTAASGVEQAPPSKGTPAQLTFSSAEVLSALEGRKDGLNADELLCHFAVGAGSVGRAHLEACLQELVDDMDILRKGGASGRQGVDLQDSCTRYFVF